MYIAFEGIEGSGKSVQIRNAENFLKNSNISFVKTREPGSTEIGVEIRKILLNGSFSHMNYLTENFLYLADRAEHFDKIIKKNIDKVEVILSDRSFYSHMVYQGYGRGIELALLESLNKVVTGDILPDYVFLFDCSVETGLLRALEREESKTVDEARFEKEVRAFHERIREGYLRFAESLKNWIIIDTEKGLKEVEDETIFHLKRILKK
jgi:dTMP kinase